MAATYGSHDVGVCARLFLGRASVLMGRVEEAICATGDAISLAHDLQHPFSLAVSHVFAAAAAQTCRQTDRVSRHAAAAAGIAREQDFRLLRAWSSAFEGWAAVMEGSQEEGLSRIGNAMTDARSTGTDWCISHVAGLAADAYLISGHAADGLNSVEDGLAIAARTGERFWRPELLRLRGELKLAQHPNGGSIEAEQDFREALEEARLQGAMLLALRSAVSLGRCLQRSGQAAEARDLILEIMPNVHAASGVDIAEANALVHQVT